MPDATGRAQPAGGGPRRLQPERHAEDLALPEPTPHGLGRIALEQTEMLANDLAKWHVRDPLAVREAASGASERFGRL